MAEIRVKSTGTLKLFENDNTSSVTIASPASLGADRTITLPDASVTLASGTMLATDGSGASLTALNASELGSGTVPTARLGSGTASSSTFLRGDQTYAAPASAADLTPACFAYTSGSIANAHNTSVTLLLAEQYDPDSAYDASTGRFTPQTAGVYFISAYSTAQVSTSGSIVVVDELKIMKNGSQIVKATISIEDSVLNECTCACNYTVSMNGSSDYFNLEGSHYNYTNTDAMNWTQTGMSIFLIKAD